MERVKHDHEQALRLIGARGWPAGEPRPTKPRIGVLGGSFNPAHDGHVHISLLALKTLRLDEVWWFVAPWHPMKKQNSMASFDQRYEQARRICAGHRKIRICALENFIPSRYTFRTVMFLNHRRRASHFVWLMGADNFIQVSRWRHWRELFRTVPVAVFNRPGYALQARCGVAARILRPHRLDEHAAFCLPRSSKPRWTFLSSSHSALSATLIRSRQSAPMGGIIPMGSVA